METVTYPSSSQHSVLPRIPRCQKQREDQEDLVRTRRAALFGQNTSPPEYFKGLTGYGAIFATLSGFFVFPGVLLSAIGHYDIGVFLLGIGLFFFMLAVAFCYLSHKRTKMTTLRRRNAIKKRQTDETPGAPNEQTNSTDGGALVSGIPDANLGGAAAVNQGFIQENMPPGGTYNPGLRGQVPQAPGMPFLPPYQAPFGASAPVGSSPFPTAPPANPPYQLPESYPPNLQFSSIPSQQPNIPPYPVNQQPGYGPYPSTVQSDRPSYPPPQPSRAAPGPPPYSVSEQPIDSPTSSAQHSGNPSYTTIQPSYSLEQMISDPLNQPLTPTVAPRPIVESGYPTPFENQSPPDLPPRPSRPAPPPPAVPPTSGGNIQNAVPAVVTPLSSPTEGDRNSYRGGLIHPPGSFDAMRPQDLQVSQVVNDLQADTEPQAFTDKGNITPVIVITEGSTPTEPPSHEEQSVA